jgi:hypothetical protein
MHVMHVMAAEPILDGSLLLETETEDRGKKGHAIGSRAGLVGVDVPRNAHRRAMGARNSA